MQALHPQKYAAEYLHQSERTLERWRVQGRGPKFVKLGKKVFYLEDDLRDYVSGSRRQSTRETAA